MTRGLNRIEDAITAMSNGDMVLVVDGEDRENEGDLIMGASLMTTQQMAFFLEHTSGYVCVAMSGARLDTLDIPMMVARNTTKLQTPMTVTVDLLHGTTTGVSARDRAMTIRALADPQSKADDFGRPGHVQPLRAVDEGVLGRDGHTEAGVDLARLAGIPEAAAICEVVTEDKLGMAKQGHLEFLATTYGIPLISIAQLVAYRHNQRVAVPWHSPILMEKSQA